METTKAESETTRDLVAVTLTDVDGNQSVVEGVATIDENGNTIIKVKDASGNELTVSGTDVRDTNDNLTVENAAVTSRTQLVTSDVSKSTVGGVKNDYDGAFETEIVESDQNKTIVQDSKSQPQSSEVVKNSQEQPAQSGELADLSNYLQNSYNHSKTTNTIITNSVGAFYTPELYNKVMELSNQWWQGQISDDDIENQLSAQQVFHENIASYEHLFNIIAKKFSYSGKLNADVESMWNTLRNDLIANNCSGRNNNFVFARAYYDGSSNITTIYYACADIIGD